MPQASAELIAPNAYKVGNFDKGTTKGVVSRQWISRPDDEKHLSLGGLLGKVRARRERSIERRIDTRCQSAGAE